MIRTIMLLPVAVLVFAASIFAQPPGPQRGQGEKGPEKIEKYKKFRMIEALDLEEEEAVRFMSKYNVHKENVRELMKVRMEIIDRLEQFIKSKGEDREIQQQFTLLEENEQKVFNERKRFHQEIRQSLTPEQAAKFFVFDRNFNRELRSAMEDMRREGRRK